MSRPIRPTPKLLPPPREVPAEVKTRVLAHRDVFWGGPFFFFAAALLYAISPLSPDNTRIGMILGAAALVALGVNIAAARLLRSLRALSIMRDGVLAPARIASCRLTWSRKRKHVPYAEFLPAWDDHVADAMRGSGSSWIRLFIAMFVVPFVLVILAIGGGVALRMAGDSPLDSEMARDVTVWVAGAALTVIGILLFLPFFDRFGKRYGARKRVIKANLERLARDLDGLSYGEIARRIEDLGEEEPRIKLTRVLPSVKAGIELDVRAEYAAGGQAQTAEGRLWLSDRLDRDGLEPLIHDPKRPTRVVFLAGLPDGVSIDPEGRWSAEPALPQRIALAITAASAGAALLGLMWHLPWLVERLKLLLQAG